MGEDEQDDSRDLRGGLTQAALDALQESPCSREDSPVGAALYRKKRSRVSVGGAGAENMLAVARETLDGTSPKKSPRKARGLKQCACAVGSRARCAGVCAET